MLAYISLVLEKDKFVRLSRDRVFAEARWLLILHDRFDIAILR